MLNSAFIMAISTQSSGYTPATTTLKTLKTHTKSTIRARSTEATGSRQYYPLIIVRPGSQDKDQQRKREMSITTN